MDLSGTILKMNIMNIVVKHKKEHFPEIPIIYFSRKEDIMKKIIETYTRNEKSYIFVSNIDKLKSVFQYLTETTELVDEQDIYFWHSNNKYKFSLDEYTEEDQQENQKKKEVEKNVLKNR